MRNRRSPVLLILLVVFGLAAASILYGLGRQASLKDRMEAPASNLPAEGSPAAGTDQVQATPGEGDIQPTESPQLNPVETASEASAEEQAQQPDTAEQSGSGRDPEVTRLLAEMTLEEKVAQLFIITPEALTGVSQVTAAGETTKAAIDAYPVGGLIYFAQNLISPDQLKQMIGNVQGYALEGSGIPLFISIDEEGGQVARIGGNPDFNVKAYGDLTSIRTPEAAYELGVTLGTYLSSYGFNLDFAPVADVYTNAANQVISRRAFSSDPEQVADLVAREVAGLKAQGMLTTLKHFPGHGNTTSDTHEGYAFTDKDLEGLRTCEFLPFKSGIAAGADIVMMAHIAAPKITGDALPCSLSRIVIQDLLREELGFDGVVTTDALNMGAIQNQYDSARAAVMAIDAGVDILLMPADFKAAYEGVLDAVQAGEISEERIDESLGRILSLKKEALDWK